MRKSNEDFQKEILETLREIAKWVRLYGIQTVRSLFEETLNREIDRLIYHYSDGRPSIEIAKLAGVSDFTVRSYWKKWSAIGIMVPSQKFKGRYERLFSLEELGIEVPATNEQGSSRIERVGEEK